MAGRDCLLLILFAALHLTCAQTTNKPSVGTLSQEGDSKNYTGCHATLLGDRAILTTRDCLYDSKAKKPRTPLHFTLGGSKVQVSKVYPPATFGGGEYDYAVGLLASALTPSSAVLAWTYEALEDAGVLVQTDNKQYSCRSSEDAKSVRMRRVSTEMMRMSCVGLASTTLPGAAVFVMDTVTSIPNIVGVYQGRCPGIRTSEVCATRIHGQIYHHVCKVASDNGLKVPGCHDPLLNVTDVHNPTVISNAEGYNELMKMNTSRGVLIQFCAKSLCTSTSCQACQECSGQSLQVFNDLDMMKALNFRVVVRTVDISDLDLLDAIETVPFIAYRKQGETEFYEYQYPLSEVLEHFAQRSKRARGPSARKRVSLPRSCKKVLKPDKANHKKPRCQKRRPKVVKGAPRNVWYDYCNANDNTFFTMSTKQRFLGQNQERHTTVLAATIVCQQGGGPRQQLAQVICQSGGGNHAERNLRNFLRNQVIGDRLTGLQAAVAGKVCEFGIVINNFPCYERCSGAVAGGQQNLVAVYSWFTANLPEVAARRIAYANFYPALRFGAACALNDQDEAVQHIMDSMQALVTTGWVPYLCTFDDAWFAAYRAAYPLQITDERVAQLKAQRQTQTHCETQHFHTSDLLTNNVPGFVWRTKANCVSAPKREDQDPMPPLIPTVPW